MAQTRCSERKSRSISELVALPRPILGTIADTILGLAGRSICYSGCRDCKAGMLRQDRFVHSADTTSLRHNLADGKQTESLEGNVA